MRDSSKYPIVRRYTLLIVSSSGNPHTNESNVDPFHGSARLGSKADFGSSGLSLHCYPDGTVQPSRSAWPSASLDPVDASELRPEDQRWLDVESVQAWKGKVAAKVSGNKKKGKESESTSGGSSSRNVPQTEPAPPEYVEAKHHGEDEIRFKDPATGKEVRTLRENWFPSTQTYEGNRTPCYMFVSKTMGRSFYTWTVQ